MYQTHRTYIKANMKMSGLIKENPRLLFLLEHFEMDFVVNDKTVSQLCNEYLIPVQLFLLFANLYNGFNPEIKEISSLNDILVIIRFLKNSHIYYKTDTYPEIIGYIKELQNKTGNEEVKLIEKFFKDYFGEVLEHLDYEDETAFPYFIKLVEQNSNSSKTTFSVNEYREHHTDIETKLADLKNLLLKHICVSNELSLRRRLFFSLLELEFDLQIHALIEEKILLPLIAEVEKSSMNG
jgi:regulator of cell morphogenesis and NO signaling